MNILSKIIKFVVTTTAITVALLLPPAIALFCISAVAHFAGTNEMVAAVSVIFFCTQAIVMEIAMVILIIEKTSFLE